MAHFGETAAIRTHRTLPYGSFTVLAVSSKQHSSTTTLEIAIETSEREENNE